MLVLRFCLGLILVVTVRALTKDEYQDLRDDLLSECDREKYGSELELTEEEEKVDRILLKFKRKEIEGGIRTQTFPAAKPFHLAKSLIEKSVVFHIIKEMPKGGALHIHDLAMIDPIWLVDVLTYRDDCKFCRNGDEIVAFSFDPKPAMTDRCDWMYVEDARNRAIDVEDFDETILEHLILTNDDRYGQASGNENNRIWESAASAWKLASELIFTEQTLGDYYYEALTQYLADGVQYIELRSLLMSNAAVFDFRRQERFLEIFRQVTEKFKKQNPDYIGSKVIKCDLRFLDLATINKSFSETIKLREKFPDFLAGYDLVAQEDLGIPLEEYLDVLLRPSQSEPRIDLPFFFHAGETNWQGTTIDMNLVDAVLLNTTRIGHGLALLKHPHLARLVKRRNIAIEVNPVSNQVLGYVLDPRNHPVTLLLADRYPVVISSDDPALWRSLPMSHDFYYVFMANTGADSGLRALKKLAMNSIEYSAMTHNEKRRATKLWEIKWRSFIRTIIKHLDKK